MVPDDGKPTATTLRIKVRHPDLDTFVERFASQVTRSGVFIPTRAPKPIGTEIRFEIRTADDHPALVGQGLVRLVRQHDPAHPRVVAGMAVELRRVGRDSKGVLLRMLEVRKRLGLVDGPGGMPLPGEHDHDEPKDDVTVARAPRPRPVAPAPPPEEPLPIAPPPPPPPAAPTLAPAAVRARPQLDLDAVAAPAVAVDDDLESWPEAARPLADVIARARALVGDDLDAELADAAGPTPVVDLATARAAAVAALGRPLRALTGDARAAPLPVPAAPVSAAVVTAVAAAVAPPAFDDATAIETPTFPTPAEPSPAAAAIAAAIGAREPAAGTDAKARTRAATAEAAGAATQARAARAQRERAKREANDRALRERSTRIQRELDARARAQRDRPPAPPIDPLAALDLDDGPRPAPTGDTTRKVDAASLAAEALGAADLRSSLSGAGADLQFLEALVLDEAPAPPRRRAAHTVPRTTPPTRPPPAAAAPPAPDDDDGIEISIDVDD
ncbi:MAG: hypothetical protein IPL61_07200 [Myxococcales bacterium]|nr:hypothetical protein [Myxococcales bacterium]